MLRSKYHDLFHSDELRPLAPGFYVDLLGSGYFYLTGIYALCHAQHKAYYAAPRVMWF